jgi:hypothetical protein
VFIWAAASSEAALFAASTLVVADRRTREGLNNVKARSPWAVQAALS